VQRVAAASHRVLTQRDLNRALLARQMLLERADLDVPTALQRMGGLQAQYAPAMYIGLWSRLVDLPRGDVTEALQRRTVVQGTLLRSTIHLVAADDYWPFALAVRAPRREWFLRVTRGDPGEAELTAAAARVRQAVADGPMRRTDLEAMLGDRRLLGNGLWLDLVRVPPSGTWERRRADLYAAAEDWLGPAPPDLTEDAGVELLVHRYLTGFGPATRAELADWAGLPVATVARLLGRMTLRRFRAEDGAELVDLPDAPLPDPQTPAPVRFLPVWDATLLVHARRSAILPEEYRPRIFSTKTPHSVNTLLVDGSVAGAWRHVPGAKSIDAGHIEVDEFEPLPRSVRREVKDEAERLAAFHR